MALNLTDISGTTPIRTFDTIYNANNDVLESYIASLETKISDLSTELERIKKIYASKIATIDSNVSSMQDSIKTDLQKDYIDNYNSLLDKIETNESNISSLKSNISTNTTSVAQINTNLNNIYESLKSRIESLERKIK